MNEKIDNAIKTLTDKITADVKADDALKFTQAALNLAHAKAMISAEKRDRGDK